jgi:general secretion pathway protein N
MARFSSPTWGRAGLSPRRVTPSVGARRWAWIGLVCGGLLTLPVFAPAAWLADALSSATQGRLQLAQAQGTVWRGSGLPVLAGPAGSRDASVLPSRLHWQLSPVWLGLQLRLSQACCLDQPLLLTWQMGPGPQQLRLAAEGQGAADATLGHWPAAWLEGLGAPLNTLRPGGELQLSGRDLSLTRQGDGWQLAGQARIDLLQASSRLATLDPLGSYRLLLQPNGGQGLRLQLLTLDGALRLSGSGDITAKGLRLRAEAQATPGHEIGLNNLLNIIGKRDGARSRISIG